jgi:hypothetical protein
MEIRLTARVYCPGGRLNAGRNWPFGRRFTVTPAVRARRWWWRRRSGHASFPRLRPRALRCVWLSARCAGRARRGRGRSRNAAHGTSPGRRRAAGHPAHSRSEHVDSCGDVLGGSRLIVRRFRPAPATRGDMLRYRLAFALSGRHALPGVMPAPMMVMKYPHRLGCINSGSISYAWCR